MPEHPAPTLKLAAKATGDTHVGGSAAPKDVAVTTVTDHDARSRATTGLMLGILATVLSIAGLVLAAIAFRRRPTA